MSEQDLTVLGLDGNVLVLRGDGRILIDFCDLGVMQFWHEPKFYRNFIYTQKTRDD